MCSCRGTHIRWLTTTCDCNSKGFDALSWPPWAPVLIYINPQTHTIKNNQIFKASQLRSLQTPFMRSSIYPFSRQSLSLCCLSGPELDGQTCSFWGRCCSPLLEWCCGDPGLTSGEGSTVCWAVFPLTRRQSPLIHSVSVDIDHCTKYWEHSTESSLLLIYPLLRDGAVLLTPTDLNTDTGGLQWLSAKIAVFQLSGLLSRSGLGRTYLWVPGVPWLPDMDQDWLMFASMTSG